MCGMLRQHAKNSKPWQWLKPHSNPPLSPSFLKGEVSLQDSNPSLEKRGRGDFWAVGEGNYVANFWVRRLAHRGGSSSMAGKIQIMETVLRDAHQCLVATRMRTEDMLPIAAKLDDIGFWALETWGGATFDATLRFLKESPWERLRQLRAAMPKTRLQMLLRGQNVVGYRNYPDDVVQAFVARAAANGIDVFRIFDAMNDVRNMKTAIEAALETGKLVEGTVCYTISPVHSADYFLRVAETLADMGVQIICLKDMGGMLAPYAAYEIIKKIKSRISSPLPRHSHCTAGFAPMIYMMAIEAGADIIDTAIAPFSQGTSQP